MTSCRLFDRFSGLVQAQCPDPLPVSLDLAWWLDKAPEAKDPAKVTARVLLAKDNHCHSGDKSWSVWGDASGSSNPDSPGYGNVDLIHQMCPPSDGLDHNTIEGRGLRTTWIQHAGFLEATTIVGHGKKKLVVEEVETKRPNQPIASTPVASEQSTIQSEIDGGQAVMIDTPAGDLAAEQRYSTNKASQRVALKMNPFPGMNLWREESTWPTPRAQILRSFTDQGTSYLIRMRKYSVLVHRETQHRARTGDHASTDYSLVWRTDGSMHTRSHCVCSCMGACMPSLRRLGRLSQYSQINSTSHSHSP